MSRSRRPKCSGGRGCWVCGDAGRARHKRDEEHLYISLAQGEQEIEQEGLPEYCTGCDFCDSSIANWQEWHAQQRGAL